MDKRPLSLTIIAWLLIVFSLFGLVLAAMAGSPTMTKAIEQMHTSVTAYRVQNLVQAIIGVACGYGILKGQPWSRVLYVISGVIGLGISFYTVPQKVGVVVGLLVLIVVTAFLFTNSANDWFSARGFMLKRERS